MKRLIVLFALVLMLSVVQGKHLHPRSLVRLGEDETEDKNMIDIIMVDETQIDAIRNVIPNRFVPMNNVLFFKTYSPCQEGFERDLLGVCREVWD